MKYRVKIVNTEVYTTWVDAESEEAAEDKALKQLNSGDLFADSEGLSTEIIDTDDYEEDNNG